MISKSPLWYLARKGKWDINLEPVPRYQVGQSYSHRRPVTNISPKLLPEDSPDNKLTTQPRIGTEK